MLSLFCHARKKKSVIFYAFFYTIDLIFLSSTPLVSTVLSKVSGYQQASLAKPQNYAVFRVSYDSLLLLKSVIIYCFIPLISGHFFKKQKIDILPAYFFIFLISYSRLFILILKKSIPSYIILLSKKLTKEECFYEIILQSRKNCK